MLVATSILPDGQLPLPFVKKLDEMSEQVLAAGVVFLQIKHLPVFDVGTSIWVGVPPPAAHADIQLPAPEI